MKCEFLFKFQVNFFKFVIFLYTVFELPIPKPLNLQNPPPKNSQQNFSKPFENFFYFMILAFILFSKAQYPSLI